MAASETSKSAQSGPGFFTIYKPGQGKFVRWGTVVAIILVTTLGMYWCYARVMPTIYNNGGGQVVTSIVLTILGLLGAFLAFIAVNRPRAAEFMIMTESEMRKVTWPTRQTVINSTKVVIFLTLLLALLLAGVDALCLVAFHWLKIL